MSSSTTDDSVPRPTPIYEETVAATAMHPDVHPADTASSGTRADAVKDAAGQARDTAKDTAQQTAGVAKDQAQQVAGAAADAGKRVGATAKDQAGKVATDAVGQARELYGQATDQLSEQAGKQQKQAASALHSFSQDLSAMHEQDQNGGPAAEFVQAVAQRAGRVAEWLEAREPAEVIDEVRQFAARRPGLFIGLAAVTGIVAARAVKALAASSGTSSTPRAAVTTAPRSAVRQFDRFDATGAQDLSAAATTDPRTSDVPGLR